MLKSFALLLLFEVFVAVQGWGPVGHTAVVHLALTELKDTAPKWVRSLTPWHWNGNLSAMGSWADDILYPDSNPTGSENWQWSRPLHYINTPDWACNYNSKRDCGDEVCIAGAIRNYTKRLETEFDEVQLKEAIYFLIHFVGDIHQPLHTGFTGDRGGNSIRGRFMNGTRDTNLHTMWDSGLIGVRIRRDFSSNNSLYYDYLRQLMIQQTAVVNDDNSLDQWIQENIKFVCEQIYLDEQNTTMTTTTNFTLGEIYYQRHISLIEQRLASGGRRLGALLNRLATNRPKPPREKLSASTIALIAVLAAEFVLAVVIGFYLCYRYKKSSSRKASYSSRPTGR